MIDLFLIHNILRYLIVKKTCIFRVFVVLTAKSWGNIYPHQLSFSISSSPLHVPVAKKMTEKSWGFLSLLQDKHYNIVNFYGKRNVSIIYPSNICVPEDIQPLKIFFPSFYLFQKIKRQNWVRILLKLRMLGGLIYTGIQNPDLGDAKIQQCISSVFHSFNQHLGNKYSNVHLLFLMILWTLFFLNVFGWQLHCLPLCMTCNYVPGVPFI